MGLGEGGRGGGGRASYSTLDGKEVERIKGRRFRLVDTGVVLVRI